MQRLTHLYERSVFGGAELTRNDSAVLKQAQVLRVDYLPEGVEVEAVCREELFGRLKRFVKEPEA